MRRQETSHEDGDVGLNRESSLDARCIGPQPGGSFRDLAVFGLVERRGECALGQASLSRSTTFNTKYGTKYDINN